MKKLHWKALALGRLGHQSIGFPNRFLKNTFLLLLALPVTSLGAQGLSVSCIGELIVTLDNECTFTVLPDNVLVGNYNTVDSIAILINDQDTNIITGCGNHTYSAELYTNDELVFNCWGSITAEDKTPPQLVCPDDTGEAVLLNDMQVISGNLNSDDSPSFDPSVHSCFLETSPPLEEGERFYTAQTFNITRSDIFTFIAAASYDGIIALYQGEFSADDPCQNLIARSDDTYLGSTEDFDPVVPLLDPSFRLSLALQNSRAYTLVWTSYAPLEEGDFGVAIFTDGDGRLTNLSKTQVQLSSELVCLDVDEVALPTTYTFSLHPDGSLILDNEDPFRIDEDVRRILDLTGFPEVSDNCTAMLMTIYDEVEEQGDCSGWIITRYFAVEDRYLSDCTDPALSSACTQTITIRRPDIGDLVLPPITTTIECDENFPTDGPDGGPEDNPSPEYTGYPYLDAALNFYDLDQAVCNLGASYSDEPRIEDCPGSYYFRREWNIVDWCSPEDNFTFDQIIRVADFTGPEIDFAIPDHNENGLADDPIKFSTAPNSCLANANIGLPNLSDGNGCSGIGSTLAQINTSDGDFVWGGVLPQLVQLEIGDYVLTFCATDQCGNESCTEVEIEVRDQIAPIAVCVDQLTVSIGGGDSQNGATGTAVVSAEDLDGGSNDHCGDVSIAIRQEGVGSWASSLLFDCGHVGASIRIHLLVTDAAQNQNTCWLTVVPEDKINPVCFPPEAESLSCTTLPITFPGNLEDAYAEDFSGTSNLMTSLFGGPSGTDNCTVDTLVERTPNIQINECGWGSVVRRFEAWQVRRPDGDLNGNGRIDINEVDRSTNSCSQTITITEEHDFVIDFPEDAAADCVGPNITTVITEADGCDVLAVNISSPEIFSATGDECYKYALTYDVINWCLWDGESDGFVVERITEDDGEALPLDRTVEGNERPVIIYNANGLVIDRQHSDRDGDSSIPDESPTLADYGRYVYIQFVKVYDSSAPNIEVMEYGGPVPGCPQLPAGAFADIHGDCEALVELEFLITDNCEVFDEEGAFVLQVRAAELDAFAVDVNQDGEITFNEFSTDEDISALITNNVDQTLSLAGDFPIIPSAMGEHVYHVVRVLIEDGCGNQTSIYVPFKVLDCKAPAPICINGLSATLMPQEEGGCGVALWASDFIGSSIYDCTGQGAEENEDGELEVRHYALYRGLEVEATPDFMPSPADSGIVLTELDDPNTVLYVYAFDNEGNYDFCETYVLLLEHNNCSAPEMGTLAGIIATEDEMPIPDVEVSISGNNPEIDMTDNGGAYAFNNVPLGTDLSIIPYLNTNPRNGVTTLDLILLSKHILGVELLDSPYKLIAADANQSNTVTTLDMIQIRKLILNITANFTHNTSWRFLPADYVFPVPSNPWAEVFPELININDFTGELAADFVGAKIGDVNGSANFNAQSEEDRSQHEPYFLEFDEQQLLAGQHYEIPVYASELAQLAGFQATLEWQGVDVAAVTYGLVQETHLGQHLLSNGYLTMSWNKAEGAELDPASPLFYLLLRAKEDLRLSEVFSLSKRYTPAEAYWKNGIHPAALRFNAVGQSSTGLKLLQNSPNPFSAETSISFILPEAGLAVIKVQNATGQELYRTQLQGTTGLNSINLQQAHFRKQAGVFTYTLTFDDITLARKLIVLP
ncbi:MAG: T9SS type A sorting domain-containing protein [Bacteroidota bacterium]